MQMATLGDAWVAVGRVSSTAAEVMNVVILRMAPLIPTHEALLLSIWLELFSGKGLASCRSIGRE